MYKRNRFNMLIFLCLLITSGLLAIQFYLLRNTYKLGIKNYNYDVTAAFLKAQSTESYRLTAQGYYDALADCSRKLESGRINEASFRELLSKKSITVILRLDSTLKVLEQKDPMLCELMHKISYKSVTIVAGSHTLRPVGASAGPIAVSGKAKAGFMEIHIGASNGSIEQTNAGKTQLKIIYAYSIELFTPPFPVIVIRQLFLVSSLSLILICGVAVLFYKVLSSARRQQKIAELRSDLVNNITHELKTPLSSMAIAFKTLKLVGTDGQIPLTQDLISTLERQHQKLSETVDRVLESAAPDYITETVKLDIVAILKGYGDGFITESHPVSIFTEPEYFLVEATLGIIEGVIDNLLENARKYSPPGSPIRIIGKPEGKWYRIDVSDSGKGISPAFHKQLFSKFYRVPENNLHSVKGLGLGLYLSQQAIHRIGGEISLSFSSVEGSVFTVNLLKA